MDQSAAAAEFVMRKLTVAKCLPQFPLDVRLVAPQLTRQRVLQENPSPSKALAMLALSRPLPQGERWNSLYHLSPSIRRRSSRRSVAVSPLPKPSSRASYGDF